MRPAWDRRALILFAAAVLAATPCAIAVAQPTLSVDQKVAFLQHARVIGNRSLGKGTTHPDRLTLSDGVLTHDAVFQSIDKTKQMSRFPGGRIELNFRDSYHYNLAAWQLAVLLGLDGMVPVTVERSWRGRTGSLAWWIDWKWDEQMRRDQNLKAPDPAEWTRQLHTMRMFTELVYDTDRNMGNLLITEDWRLWMVDFTRAFRVYPYLNHPELVQRCSRDFNERLRALTRERIRAAVGDHLTGQEISALLKRRDWIAARLDELIAQRGEASVLF
jgi:hypothetical protein